MRTCSYAMAFLACAATAAAQAPAVTQDEFVLQGDTTPRRALPTIHGDTGFWFVPTAETMPSGKWSFSLYGSQFDRHQGLMDVRQFGLTGAVALGNRFELFGTWRVVRIDRDVRPIFVPTDDRTGGISHEYPYVRGGWSKTLGGPTNIGGKFSLFSQSRGDAMSLAPRFMIKIPTGPEGSGTNGLDGQVDLIGSREIGARVELSGFVGGIVRGDPDEFRIPNSFTWGVGGSVPTRTPIRAIVEFHGDAAFSSRVSVIGSPLVAEDGSVAPTQSPTVNPKNLTVGGVWQMSNGLFLHGGLNYSVGVGRHTVAGRVVDHNPLGFEFRLGWHPGVTPSRQRVRVVKETTTVTNTVAPPVPAPPPPANRPPAVTAACNPCTLEPGRTANLTASGTDPDGDPLTYQWTTPQGTFNNPNAANTIWTAPAQEGSVTVAVTARDGRGGTATGSTTLLVVRRETIVFEDVHFDFDRSTIRPDALQILDGAVAKLQSNRDVQLTIEGHCDSMGTLEYNLALGERRANAVRDYLVSRGIAAARMRGVSYGEERPVADNTTAEGRAMNRRAHFVVAVQ